MSTSLSSSTLRQILVGGMLLFSLAACSPKEEPQTAPVVAPVDTQANEVPAAPGQTAPTPATSTENSTSTEAPATEVASTLETPAETTTPPASETTPTETTPPAETTPATTTPAETPAVAAEPTPVTPAENINTEPMADAAEYYQNNPEAANEIASDVAEDIFFPTCAAVQAADLAPLHKGQPGYRPELDENGDGVACE